jgi:hypothetical protein
MLLAIEPSIESLIVFVIASVGTTKTNLSIRFNIALAIASFNEN